MGESWHNLHHADPTCARHGVLRGQLDSSARIIWLMEKLGWVYDVRWPVRERIDAKLVVQRRSPTLPTMPGLTADDQVSGGHAGSQAAAAGRSRMTAAERREQLIEIARGLFAERGFDGDVDRGDRRPRRGLQAGRLRALRRQGGPLRGRRRPRGPRPARR